MRHTIGNKDCEDCLGVCSREVDRSKNQNGKEGESLKLFQAVSVSQTSGGED